MNKRQLHKISRVLIKAVEAHLKRGGKLIAEDFYITCKSRDDNEIVSLCKCPLQVVTESIPDDKTNRKEPRIATSDLFSKAIGFPISRDEMYAIINGYDNGSNEWGLWRSIKKETYNSLYAIGKELRKNFKPLTKPQINKIMGFKYV